MNELEKYKNSIYLLNIETLIKLDLRYTYALWVIDKKYDDVVDILKVTLKLTQNWVYINPYHLYLTHFLLGYWYKMIFYNKIMEFQTKNAEMIKVSPKFQYRLFVDNLPPSGLAAAKWFYMLPNYSRLIKTEWK